MRSWSGGWMTLSVDGEKRMIIASESVRIARETVCTTAEGVAASHKGTPVQSYAYLKISDGCDELCTFCAIPGIKGPYHPLTAAEILREADACLVEGVQSWCWWGRTRRFGGTAISILQAFSTAWRVMSGSGG